MKFSTTISVLAVASAASAAVQNVDVGGSGTNIGFIFNPPNITAAVGDVITFTFSGSPGNHSVTQSSFNGPCDLLSDGFDTGTIFIPPGLTSGFPTWNLTITDASKPIWYFCKQLAPQPHCSQGMVGAINAPSSGNTFDSFLANAKAFSGNPAQSVGFLVGEGASASTIPGPLTGSISGFGVPTATAPASGGATSTSSSGSSTSAPAATSSSAALGTKANTLVVVLAAMFGVALV